MIILFANSACSVVQDRSLHAAQNACFPYFIIYVGFCSRSFSQREITYLHISLRPLAEPTTRFANNGNRTQGEHSFSTEKTFTGRLDYMNIHIEMVSSSL